jgi:cyanate permease
VFFAVVDQGLGKPVEFVGVLGAIQGVGAILAGVTITALIRRTGELRPVPWAFAVIGMGALLSTSSLLPVVAAGTLLFGAGLPVLIVCLTTVIQRRTPGELMGRTFTAFELFTGVPQLLSILGGAVAVSLVDYRIPLVAMALGVAAAGVYSALRLREDPAASQLGDPAVVDLEVPVGAHVLQQTTVVADEQQGPVVRR